MKLIQFRSLPLFSIALALSLCWAAPSSAAADPAKVDLAEAKAELAKAKAAAEKADADRDTAEKSPRKRRLFGRDKKEKDKAIEIVRPVETQAAEKEEQPKQETAKERKARPRLFKRAAEKKAAPKKEDALEIEVEPAEGQEDKSRGLKRFSPFSKADDVAPVDEVPAEKPEVAKVEPEPAPEPEKQAEDGERRKLLGGLFARDSSEPEVEKPTPAKSEEKKSSNKGAVFGLFRKGESKDVAKADKTKLGKSIESKPAKPSTGALAKSSANSGALGWYVITESSTPFYAIGPGQPMPPEKLLDRGSMLTVTKGGWGWCNVELGSGQLGVISAKAMRPATVAEISRHTRGIATAGKSRGSRSLFNILSRGPAPTLDLPTSSGGGPIRNFGLLPPVDPSE